MLSLYSYLHSFLCLQFFSMFSDLFSGLKPSGVFFALIRNPGVWAGMLLSFCQRKPERKLWKRGWGMGVCVVLRVVCMPGLSLYCMIYCSLLYFSVLYSTFGIWHFASLMSVCYFVFSAGSGTTTDDTYNDFAEEENTPQLDYKGNFFMDISYYIQCITITEQSSW